MSNEQQTETSILETLPKQPVPETYFEPSTNKYWVLNDDKEWSPLFKADMVHKLHNHGYSARPDKGKVYSEADNVLLKIREGKCIAFAGQVAGNMSGVHQEESRYLVTRSPKLIVPKAGDWTTIRELGARLFGEEQLEYVLGWSKNALEGLYNQQYRRGQLLVLAGPASSGKSFWQNRIITPMLGGRVAKPLQFMLGGTSFNEDIIRSEHLMLEDENAKTDYKSRCEFAANIKIFTVNTTQRVHPKGKSAFMIKSSHWISMSLNDDPQALNILPPMDSGVEDKVMLLKVAKAITQEWPGIPNKELETQIEEQIPAFVHYLLNQHVIAEDKRDLRMGIAAFHHPELLEHIMALQPEAEMENVVDRIYTELSAKGGKWTGTASELQATLEGHPDFSWKTRKMFYSVIICGKYLERLARQKPEKFYKENMERVKRGGNWVIDWGNE